MSEIDRDLERWFVEHRIGWLDPIAVGLSWVGVGAAIWLVIGLAMAIRAKDAWLFLRVGLAAVIASLGASLLQGLFDRPRPPLALGVEALIRVPDSGSLPSGHATTSFACAVVLAGSVRSTGVRIGLLALATAIAVSRPYVGVHYPLDVLAGAALGAAIGLLLAGLQKPRRQHP